MNLSEWLITLNNAGPSFLRQMVSLLWQSTLLLSTAWILTIILRRRSATVRHMVWTIVLFCVPLIPLLNWTVTEMNVPKAPLQILSVVESSSPPEIERPSGKENIYGLSQNSLSPQQAPSPISETSKNIRPPVRHFYPWAFLLILYFTVVTFFLGVILDGRRRIRRWLRKGSVVTDPVILETFSAAMSKLSFRKYVKLIESSCVTAPFTIRTFCPVILLPSHHRELFTDTELTSVALHELAHVQRKDPLLFSLISIIRAVFFFHPLVWLAAHRVSLLAELACDDRVIESSGEPIAYAKTLTRLAEKISTREFTTELAAGIIYSRSSFFHRVESVLSERRAHIKKLSRFALTGLVITGITSITLTAVVPLGEKNSQTIQSATKTDKHSGFQPADSLSNNQIILTENINSTDSTLVSSTETISSDPDSSSSLITVSGTVTFQGKPVSGADIYQIADPSSYYGTNSKSTQKMTRTGKDGSFVYKTPLIPKNPLGGGDYVIASHPNYSWGGKIIQGDTDVSQLSIKVTVPLTISGKVQNKDGEPIKGAEVELRIIHILNKISGGKPSSGKDVPAVIKPPMGMGGIIETFDLEPEIPGTKVFSNQDGKFIIHRIPESSESLLKVTAKGYAKVEKTKIEAGADEVNFVLVQEGIISGRLTFADNQKPAPNATVSANEIGMAGGGAGKTDKNGKFLITGLTPGIYSLFSLFPNSPFSKKLGEWAPVKKENVSVEAGKTTNVDMQFTHGGIVTGTITDKDTGEPIPGWGVGMTDAQPSFTDSKGVFRFRAAPGERSVYAYFSPVKGYIIRMEKERPEKTVEVKEGETISGVDFQFSKGVEMHGIVQTPDGKPVAGAVINSKHYGPGGTRAISDSLGHFTLNGLITGEKIEVIAEKPEEHLETSFEIEVDPTKELKFVLNKYETGKIEGRVIGANGKPASGIEIYLMRNDRQRGVISSVVAHSDKDGKFKIEKLDMGELYIGERYMLEAQNGQAKSEYFILTENMKPIDIILPKADSWLEGTITDSDGKPAVGVRVMVNGGPSGLKFTYSDAKGHYRLDGLVGETERIFLDGKGYGFSQFKNVSLNQKHDFAVSKKEQ
jgi:beta-lactamase regulating signal transducer with metallopeptidase domain